jgi:hypothetical protein
VEKADPAITVRAKHTAKEIGGVAMVDVKVLDPCGTDFARDTCGRYKHFFYRVWDSILSTFVSDIPNSAID